MNDTRFNCFQLRQIRLGLEQKIDVSAYARISMSEEDMEKIRQRLLKELSERDLEAEKERKLEQQQIKAEVSRKRLHNQAMIPTFCRLLSRCTLRILKSSLLT